MTDDNFDSGFIRARRNLILMSTLILIYASNAIGLNENSSFNGVPVHFKDINTVELWLLIFNLYFIWRYCANTDISHAIYNYKLELETSMEGLIKKKSQGILRNMIVRLKADGSEVTRLERTNEKGHYAGLFVIKYKFDTYSVPQPPKRANQNEILGSNFISPLSLIWINFWSIVKGHFFKITFTEKILPLMLGVTSAVALFYKIYGD